MSGPLDERLAALEAVVGIGHNGGPPLDDDEPPKRRSRACSLIGWSRSDTA